MPIKKKIKRILSNIVALFQYNEINKALAERYDIYFFFNSWEFGGAERVHLQILDLFKDKKIICFITDEPNNNGFKNEFMNSCKVLKLGRWSQKKSYAKHMRKKIATSINNYNGVVL